MYLPKDLGTGKSQNVVIKSTTNMSESDIDKAVKEAEQHAAEDKKSQGSDQAKIPQTVLLIRPNSP